MTLSDATAKIWRNVTVFDGLTTLPDPHGSCSGSWPNRSSGAYACAG